MNKNEPAFQKIELYPLKDAYVCDCKPDETNPNGNESVLYQGQYKKCFDRTLIQWDLSTLESRLNIVKAEIYLYQQKLYFYGKKMGQLVYHPITEPWDEETVSYNTLPAHNDQIKIISAWTKEEGWTGIDITKIVKEWYENRMPNYGLYCHSEATSSTCVSKFVSSEGKIKKYRPKLVIEYNDR